MEQNNSMLQDLLQAQREFDPVLKDSTNPFHKSKYADLESCINAIKEPLNRNNFILTQITKQHDKGVCVETRAVHINGEVFSGGELFLPAGKEDPQGFGSALTYARRYSLLATFGMAPEDDDGQGAVSSLKFDSEWFRDKLVPLAIRLCIEGKVLKADGIEDAYNIEKASKLLAGYASKQVSKEKILDIYKQYEEAL